MLVEVEEDDFWFRGFNMRTGERGVFPAFYAHAVPGTAKDLLGEDQGSAIDHPPTEVSDFTTLTLTCPQASPPPDTPRPHSPQLVPPQGASVAHAGWTASMCSSWAPWRCPATRAMGSFVRPCRRSVRSPCPPPMPPYQFTGHSLPLILLPCGLCSLVWVHLETFIHTCLGGLDWHGEEVLGRQGGWSDRKEARWAKLPEGCMEEFASPAAASVPRPSGGVCNPGSLLSPIGHFLPRSPPPGS